MTAYSTVFMIAVVLAVLKGVGFYVLCSSKMSKKTAGTLVVIIPVVLLVAMYVLFGLVLR